MFGITWRDLFCLEKIEAAGFRARDAIDAKLTMVDLETLSVAEIRDRIMRRKNKTTAGESGS